MNWGYIVEQWVKRLVLGQIRYDPCKVVSRWVPDEGGNSGRLKAIRNGSRKDRLAKKAA